MNHRIKLTIFIATIFFSINCQAIFQKKKQLNYQIMAKENIRLLFKYLTLGDNIKTQELLSNDILISGYGKDRVDEIIKTISNNVELSKNYSYKAIKKINNKIKVRLKMESHKNDFTFTLNESGKFSEINIIKLKHISDNSKDQKDLVPSNSIPFELFRNYIVFKVKIKNRLLNFMLDTGAEITLIDKKVAQNLNLPNNGRITYNGVSNNSGGYITTINNLKLSDQITIKNLTTGTVDLSKISDYFDTKIDGIIGSQLLSSLVIKIDFNTKSMSFANTISNFNTQGYNTFFFSTKDGIPEINTTMKLETGKVIKGKMSIDTGYGGNFFLSRRFVKKNKILSKLEPKKEKTGTDIGGHHKTFLTSVASMSFLNETFNDVPTLFSKSKLGKMGLIGNRIISRYNWVFDYKKNKAYYKRNNFYSKPFQYLCTPFFIVKKKNKLLFIDVDKTDKSQIKNGYEVVSVNKFKTIEKIRELIHTENIELNIIYLDGKGHEKNLVFRTKRII
ncbi:retropepsin-like aspartic protease [uncultured Tenacibaculum sp.]|uniref:retropepsin-like aspartic protease n=1 Tax=uncultured Tenacibaculum sp. TaxID=174713 RepID=UPI002638E252|nr:retropepsin-like aspartic protease [uncultured Tenacibaculum sp.]